VPQLGRIAFLGTGAFGIPLLARLPELSDQLLVISHRTGPRPRPPDPLFARDRLGTGPRPASRDPAPAPLGRGPGTPPRVRPDGLLLAAYGQLLPADLLEVAARLPLNVHPSLLPRHRGAAPVASTILAGDPEGGVTLMVMTAELDAGPIVAKWPVSLGGRETTPELEARLAELAAEVVPAQLEAWAGGEIETIPQDERQGHHDPSLPTSRWLDRLAQSAVAIDRRVRALQPWPGAWTTLDGRRLHIRAAHPVAGLTGPWSAPSFPANGRWWPAARGRSSWSSFKSEGSRSWPPTRGRRGLPREHVLLGGGAASGVAIFTSPSSGRAGASAILGALPRR
jgi:methionyl-tRNA formyltransferase